VRSCADDITLAVIGDLLDLALAEVALDLTAVEAFRLSGQAHDPADLVKSGLSLRAERREDVAQIDGILCVPVEVRTHRKPWRRYPVEHGSVAQHGQVEAVAVERHELRAQLRDLVAERGDQLLLSPLAHMGRTDGVHRPVIGLPVRDQSSDADDRVVNVLRELVADRLADLHVGLADEVVGSREPANLSDAAGSSAASARRCRDSTSCASTAPQLKREWSLLAIFGRANRSYHDISNTWLAHGFLRSR
jgi:hypothetical protein